MNVKELEHIIANWIKGGVDLPPCVEIKITIKFELLPARASELPPIKFLKDLLTESAYAAAGVPTHGSIVARTRNAISQEIHYLDPDFDFDTYTVASFSLSMSEYDLSRIPNMGRISIERLKSVLKQYGHELRALNT